MPRARARPPSHPPMACNSMKNSPARRRVPGRRLNAAARRSRSCSSASCPRPRRSRGCRCRRRRASRSGAPRARPGPRREWNGRRRRRRETPPARPLRSCTPRGTGRRSRRGAPPRRTRARARPAHRPQNDRLVPSDRRRRVTELAAIEAHREEQNVAILLEREGGLADHRAR